MNGNKHLSEFKFTNYKKNINLCLFMSYKLCVLVVGPTNISNLIKKTWNNSKLPIGFAKLNSI